MVIYKWLKHQSLKYHLGTLESQKHPDETNGAAADFMEFIQTKVSETNRDPKVILSMDQNPNYFTYHGKNLLSMKLHIQ